MATLVTQTDGLSSRLSGAWRSLPRWVSGRMAAEGFALLAFTGIILASSYALAGMPNVKLFDLLVFVAGYTLGFRRGAAVAILSWLVYGNGNPWGLTTPALLATVATSELAYAAAGALFRKVVSPGQVRLLRGRHALMLAGLALVSTLLYDLFTNVYTGISWAQFAGSSDYARWVWTALFNPGALWFSGAHVGSNIVFFAAFAPVLIKGAERIKQSVH